jgi:hypothetical protein
MVQALMTYLLGFVIILALGLICAYALGLIG